MSPAYSGPAFDARAISSIVIDPGNPNIMYVGRPAASAASALPARVR